MLTSINNSQLYGVRTYTKALLLNNFLLGSLSLPLAIMISFGGSIKIEMLSDMEWMDIVLLLFKSTLALFLPFVVNVVDWGKFAPSTKEVCFNGSWHLHCKINARYLSSSKENFVLSDVRLCCWLTNPLKFQYVLWAQVKFAY